MDGSAYPAKIDLIRKNLAESRNVFGEDNAERAEWVEDMRRPPEHGYNRETAEVAYITGCVAAYFPLAQKIPIALAEIFDASGVDFTILGEEEWCCGFPLLGAGLMEHVRGFPAAEPPRRSRPRGRAPSFSPAPPATRCGASITAATSTWCRPPSICCGCCARAGFRLREVPLTVTYHDPCDLGRGARVFEAPREAIRSIPGVTLVEMAHHGESCRCCGGGGNLEMVDPGLAARIARDKVDEVLATGAQAVVTSCQQCVRTMTATVKRNKIPLEVLDIVQLVRRALKPASLTSEPR